MLTVLRNLQMVHDQTFHIIIRQDSHWEGTLNPPLGDVLSSSVGLRPGYLHESSYFNYKYKLNKYHQMGLISQYTVKGVLHFYLYLKYLISDPAIQMSIDDHIKVFPPFPPSRCRHKFVGHWTTHAWSLWLLFFMAIKPVWLRSDFSLAPLYWCVGSEKNPLWVSDTTCHLWNWLFFIL